MTARLSLLVTMAALACETRAPTVAPRDATTADRPDAPEDVAAIDAPLAADVDAPEAPAPEVPRVAVTTFHHDIQRTGANRAERVLTPARLRSGAFGRDPGFAPALDGDVYGQPLYLPRVAVGTAERAVVYVATQANSLYGLDADTGATLWRTRVGPAVPLVRMPCGNIGPTTGTVSTPVIVRETGTLYAVSYTSEDGGLTRHFVISAVDVATGAQRPGFPARIAPPPSNGSTFDAGAQGQRGALTYVDGRVYVPFGGLANDCGFFHGWVVGVDPVDPREQTSFATPGSASGIWSYGGPSSDGAGSLYVATGNGRTATSMGSRVIRLGTGPRGPSYEDVSARWFAPSNHLTLDGGDVDLNSIQPMVLPARAGSLTPRLLFQAGKSGIGYLLDRDDLGGVGRGNGDVGEGVFSAPVSGRGAFGAAATWSDGREVYVFVPSRGYRFGGCNGRDDPGGVLTLRLRTDVTGSAFTRTWCSAGVSNPSAPTVSSNGDRDALLWVAGTTPPELRAYDVAEGVEVYRATGADAPPSVRQWVPPVVVEGNVYVTGSATVLRYRLRSEVPELPPRPLAVAVGPARTIAPWFLGLDGDHAQAPPWSDRAYTAALVALHPGSLRYPGGASANFWHWPVGWFQPGFGPAAAPSPALLETFAPVVTATGATPVFTLNVLSSQGHLATAADDAAMVRLQHAMLVHARTLGMPVYLVELGDGLTDDLPVPSGAPADAAATRFPSGADYARAINPWLVTFHQGFADARLAVVAAGSPSTPRAAAWNAQLLATVRNADALAVRLELPVSDPAFPAGDVLALPFRAWAALESGLLPRLRERSLDLWVSASGLRDRTPTQAFASTWLQGAVAATLGLLSLSDPLVARSCFASATGDADVAALFPRAYALGDGPRATALGRSAAGVVFSAFSRALDGARAVRPLIFPDAPTLPGGAHPALLGVRVTAADGRVRVLVLHLGERPVAVDLGAVVTAPARYEQTAAPWATRVTGAPGELTTEAGELRGVVTLAPRSLTLVSP